MEELKEKCCLQQWKGLLPMLVLALCLAFLVPDYGMAQERAYLVAGGMSDGFKAGTDDSAPDDVSSMVEKCSQYEYGEDTPEDDGDYDSYDYEESSGFSVYCLMTLPFALIFAGIGTFALARAAGGQNTTTFKSYMENGKNGLIGRYDRYTHTTTTRKKKPKENSGGGNHEGFPGGGGVGGNHPGPPGGRGGHPHPGGGGRHPHDGRGRNV